ncbi:MAG: hypothetical protein IJ635_00510 [Bacteroidaceae bacterium]|nr:hypothetical protein [Bacteroidaceae bacterium]
MNDFILIFTMLAAATSMALTCYLVLAYKEREKKVLVQKAIGTEMDAKRVQLEEDVYAANDRLVSSTIGFDVNKNIYNEKLDDIYLSEHVVDDSFFREYGFQTENMTVKKDSIICLMPFHPKYNSLYNQIIRVAKSSDFLCQRSDDVYKPNGIMRYTLELILEAQIVIGVLDGRNPNVFYEIGIAHSIGKTVILIAAEKEKNIIPFDLNQHRFIFYKSLRELEEKLTDALKFLRENDRTRKEGYTAENQ